MYFIKCPQPFQNGVEIAKIFKKFHLYSSIFISYYFMKIISKDTFSVFLIVSIAYIASYTLTNGFIVPLQTMLLPSYTATISLLFLPHGIRVLAAYYYGWKAFFYLIPSTYLMWFVIVYGAGVPLHPLQPALSPLCCIIGVKIISKNKTGNIEKEWKILLLGGFIGSVLNGISSSFIYNNGVITSSMYGYIFGDMLGQITLMIILVYIFKFVSMFR